MKFRRIIAEGKHSVHSQHNNLQLLATEIFKTQKNLNPGFMNRIFDKKNTPYTLRSGRNISAPKPSTTRYGIENARFFRAKIWRTIPSSLKESQTLNSFRKSIISLFATVDYVKDLLKI